eukprot:scaffold568343_cov18-Prasinocladus_malaysianus.AAC.1
MHKGTTCIRILIIDSHRSIPSIEENELLMTHQASSVTSIVLLHTESVFCNQSEAWIFGGFKLMNRYFRVQPGGYSAPQVISVDPEVTLGPGTYP